MNSNPATRKKSLRSAIVRNDADAIVQLIAQGADVNSVIRLKPSYVDQPTRSSLLMLAVQQSDIGCIKALLENGADLHMKLVGHTALTEAVMRGNTDILRLLLEHGADINDRGDHGKEYILCAYIAFNIWRSPTYDGEMVSTLSEHGAILDLTSLDSGGYPVRDLDE